MCAGTCHLTAFCSHISPKWRFLHRHAGKSVPARKKLFRQCAGTRSPQQHPPPLTWLGCLVLGCPFGVCAGVLVAFFAPQPVKHVSIHDPKIDLLFALPGERFGNYLGCLGELRLGPRIVCQMWCIVAAPDVNLAGPDESAWLTGSAGRTLGVVMKDGKARQGLSSNSTPATQPNATHLTPHTHTHTTTTSPPFPWLHACEWLLGVIVQVAAAAPSGR